MIVVDLRQSTDTPEDQPLKEVMNGIVESIQHGENWPGIELFLDTGFKVILYPHDVNQIFEFLRSEDMIKKKPKTR